MDQYVLDENHKPVLISIEEYLHWVKRCASHGRMPIQRVGLTRYGEKTETPAMVSTVFLTIAGGWDGEGNLHLFETLIDGRDLGATYSDVMERYTTWEGAKSGHKHWCRMLEIAYDDLGPRQDCDEFIPYNRRNSSKDRWNNIEIETD